MERGERQRSEGERVGKGLTGDDVELVGAALEILLPIVEYVVQDDVAGTG
jgi:hypothetical protein